jgi:hypothetical protein
MISRVDVIHLSVIHCEARGNVFFPEISERIQDGILAGFQINIDYTYQIWTK